MKNWRDCVEGCFGRVDKIFAGHPDDQERAREMLRQALDAGATMRDIEGEGRKFLVGSSPAHIDEQVERMGELENYLSGGE